MDVELTRTGKYSLILHSPVMPAAGTFGYGDRYTRLIKTDKLGAIVTNAISLKPRRPARGTHVIPLSGGMLLHTGLPNPGAKRVLKEYETLWKNAPVPVIAHVIDRDPVDLRRCVKMLMDVPNLAAFELGLHEGVFIEELRDLIDTVTRTTELPVLVRVPLERAAELAPVVADSDAGALVVGAPPRGIALDPIGGQPIRGRVFGPLVKPQALNAVLSAATAIQGSDLPVIGAGGIHTQEDAYEFIAVGARAVQLDSLIWVHPEQAEIIARDLGGYILTRKSDAYPDEWFPGIGETFQGRSVPRPPDTLPE